MKGKRCLVTGATGAVGPSVVSALLDQDVEVSVLSRQPPPEALFPARVKLVLGDLTDVEAVTRATRDQDWVVHLAALLHVNQPSASVAAEMHRVNVDGTRNLVEASRLSGVARLVFISTIAVYGYGGPGILFETSVPSPTTIYGESKLAAEHVALSTDRADGLPLSTVLRLSAVYGPRIKGNYQALLSALARKRFVPIGQGLNQRTLVHCDDVAQAVCCVLKNEQAAGRVFNVTDGAYHPLHTVIGSMCQALGRPEPRWAIPAGLAKPIFRAADVLCKQMGRPAKFEVLLDKYLEEVRVDGTALSELGYRPRFDLLEGWDQTVRQLRREGSL